MRPYVCAARFGVIATAALAALATGCATSRGTLDVRGRMVQNPQNGIEVKLGEVTDRRVFEHDPPMPSTPSLKDGQIENRSITSRAIARKRNTYGKALGDILLPEGRTVEEVGREVLTSGLRDSGFRVLEEGEPGFEAAVSLQAEIEKFWTWVTPGFWAVHVEFETSIRVSGPIDPFVDGEEFRGYVRLGTQAATGRAYLNTIYKGLEALDGDMKLRLQPAASRPPSASEAVGSGAGP